MEQKTTFTPHNGFLGDRSFRNDVRKIKYCNLCTMYRRACEGPSWMHIFSTYDTFIKLEIEFRIGAKLATILFE